MSDRAFIDTNVLIYIYSAALGADERKRNAAFSEMGKYDCLISTQVLNEFCNVCIKKWNIPTADILGIISIISSYCDMTYISEETIESALNIK